MEYRKKLIEVALPLEAINKESSREKSIRHGHPSTLHLWWARRPLAACRAVLFASLVDDPSAWPDLFPTDEDQETERKRIFEIIEQLVKWENSNNEDVILQAQTEIALSISRNLGDEMPEGKEAIREYLATKAPPVLDPFCGGGSIPIEAQRLGLQAYASDLNPVAVLITKALIEIPPKFAGLPPVNPEAREDRRLMEKEWKGAEGLAEDVRYYGKLMRDAAEKRIGYLYPKVKITDEMTKDRPDLEPYVGQELTVIAWLWARTVPSPNPACKGVHIPLIRSFWLSTKKGKEAYVRPIINRQTNTYRFEVNTGEASFDFNPSKGTVNRTGAFCLFTDTHMPFKYIREEGRKANLGERLMAIAAEGTRGRVYLSPIESHDAIARSAVPEDVPTAPLPDQALGFRIQQYGMNYYKDLFTSRQLVALSSFSDLVKGAHDIVLKDATTVSWLDEDDQTLDTGGTGNNAYADAVSTYLAFGIDRLLQQFSTLAMWSSNPAHELVVNMFSRQVLAMTWDYGEINPFCQAASWEKVLDYLCKALETSGDVSLTGHAWQQDARSVARSLSSPCIISTDPPYYDNIGYADLSDYFYIWLRRSLNKQYPLLFSTLMVPKSQELVAAPHRFGGKRNLAEEFFEKGLVETIQGIKDLSANAFPFTLFYAFKQSEVSESELGTSLVSTGWETMLQGVLAAGFNISGTWPIRTERQGRMRSQKSNALASSIVLACRPRPDNAPLATRREFLSALKNELPDALKNLQHGNIAPVDLAQASIGPGMAVFTRYSKVMESDGSPMTVRTALGLINQTLDEVLAEQEGEFDPDTRWAIAWFEQYGMEEGQFGVAETLSKAKDTAVGGLVESGILEAGSGKVRLLKRDEMPEDWEPAKDKRFTIWEATQYLIRDLDQKGEQGATDLLKKLGGGYGETARDLSYRLYNICERKGWASDALAYNSLVIAWPEITRLAHSTSAESYEPQTGLFENE